MQTMLQNQNQKPAPDCAVIVSSCDAFEDAWKPFFTLFFRYWPDCPFPIYLISNLKTYPDSRVNPLLVGSDQGWATNTKYALERVSEPYLIWILEDFLFEKQVDTALILKLVDWFKLQSAATLRLHPSPLPDELSDSVLPIGRISTHAPYRVSLSAGLWNRGVFMSLIKDGENPWQMEYEGTERSRGIPESFFSTTLPVLPYAERGAIIRGRWTPEAVKLCAREGITLDLSKRTVIYSVRRSQKFDVFRKQKWIQALRRIPLLGKLGGWLFWKLRNSVTRS